MRRRSASRRISYVAEMIEEAPAGCGEIRRQRELIEGQAQGP